MSGASALPPPSERGSGRRSRRKRFARGGRTEPAKLNKLFGVAPTLRDPKTVLADIAQAQAPDGYLRSLHPKHEQFQLLHHALV